jgi:dolichol kinase
MKLQKEEILRKLLHLIALLIPLGIFYMPQYFMLSKWLPAFVLGIIFSLSFIVEILRFRIKRIQKYFLKVFGSMMREKEEFSVTGSTYIIGSGFLCSVFFVNRPEIAFISLFSFILADASAALAGIEFGRIKIRGKSLEGSLACFFTAFILLHFIYPKFPLVMENFGGFFSLKNSLEISFIIAFLEFYSIKIFKFEINDNLYVPVLCGFAVSFI